MHAMLPALRGAADETSTIRPQPHFRIPGDDGLGAPERRLQIDRQYLVEILVRDRVQTADIGDTGIGAPA
jgi:hypothetical protein